MSSEQMSPFLKSGHNYMIYKEQSNFETISSSLVLSRVIPSLQRATSLLSPDVLASFPVSVLGLSIHIDRKAHSMICGSYM